jgi:anti-sigma regulatory factor (Ser/Thr protein kinase)
VLIGVSRYSSLRSLSPVRRSLSEMASVLTDKGVCRLPPSHCAVVQDPSDGNAVGRAVGRAAAEATDMLLVYYAGHGLGGLRRNQLFLALKDTDPERPAFHSLAYDVLREEVLDSPADSRVVILDCCFSGRAAAPIMASESATILEQLDIAGAYVLTASPANQPAITGSKITEFTGELVEVLRRGVPGAPPLLTLDTLYAHLRAQMKARNLPQPRRLHTDAAGRLALAPNPMHSGFLNDPQDPRQSTGQPLSNVEPSNSLPAASLINLARRSGFLADRLIANLDRLERGEQEPERLSELFELDHLAVRVRRAMEGLLVLAGADSSHVQRQSASLINVLRAAQSEIEQYKRIQFGSIEHGIEITASAINDVVHLVAELLDNATAFSPPHTEVVVKARRLRSGVAIEIMDRGIGMSSEAISALNQVLSAPLSPTPQTNRMLGSLLVARLAARHKVAVELRTNAARGTTADVILPPAIVSDQQPPPTSKSSARQVVADPVQTVRGRARVPQQRLDDTAEIPRAAR